MRGIRHPAGCHDDDNVHNWELAWHGIINEVLVACEQVRAPLCRSMLIKNTREFSASLLYIFIFYLYRDGIIKLINTANLMQYFWYDNTVMQIFIYKFNLRKT